MGRNRNVWFNQKNLEYIEKKVKKESSNFNKKVNDIITNKRLETEKEKV